MWIDLPNLWIVVLNVICIPAIHLGVSWLFTRMPRRCFDPESAYFRERTWESGGWIYQRWFRIRQWKALLPDAATWFDGFPKKNLDSRDPDYLRDFIRETCRGEAAHLGQLLAILLTIAWNPWPTAALVMIAYALLSNFPCLILQRFTRARLKHLLEECLRSA